MKRLLFVLLLIPATGWAQKPTVIVSGDGAATVVSVGTQGPPGANIPAGGSEGQGACKSGAGLGWCSGFICTGGACSFSVPILGASVFTADVAGTVPLTVKGAAAQTADLQTWKNSSNVRVASIGADGTLTVVPASTASYLFQYLKTDGTTNLLYARFDGTNFHWYYGAPVWHNLGSYSVYFLGTNAWVNFNGATIGANPAINGSGNPPIWVGPGSYATAVTPLTAMQILKTTTFAWNGSDGYTVSAYSLFGQTQLSTTPGDARVELRNTLNSPFVTWGLLGGTTTLTGQAAASVPLTIQGAAAQSANLQEWKNGVGTVASISAAGMATLAPIAFASLGTPANGTIAYCSDCAPQSNPCTATSTGAFAHRLNGAWDCR